METMQDLINRAKGNERPKLAVAVAQEKSVLSAAYSAHQEGIADSVLVGDRCKIERLLDEMNMERDVFEIVNVDGDLQQQAEKAVELISKGQAQVLMKGMVDTSILLKTLLKKEYNLRTGRVMSSIAVVDSPFYHKLLLITDPAMNIRPDLATKKQIVENAVEVARNLGMNNPKTAILCAKEKVNEKMPETLDAAELVKMNEAGEIKGCIIGGPLALDNIVSKAAAELKGIDHPVAGDADIIVVPDLVSGNTLYKSMAFLSKVKSAGVIQGAKVPIVVTSRADSEEDKLYSIALAALVAKFKKAGAIS